jgi:hypothetical protein
VEQWGRSHGVHTIAAVVNSTGARERPENPRGIIAQALVDAATSDDLDVTEWLQSGAERARNVLRKLPDAHTHVEASARSKGFPILASEK